MDGTGELFAPLLAALPPEISATVVAYPDRPATYAEHVRVARAELPGDRPYMLLGESFSGPVAISLAATAPAGLIGLILCASFLTCPSRLLRMFRPLTAFASPKLVPGFVAHHSLLGRFATPALKRAHAQALRHVASPTLTARLRAMADVDVRDEMRKTGVPSLYIRATADRVVGRSFGDEFMEHAQQGRLVEVDAPHFLLQTQPQDSARLIVAFMGG